VVLVGLVLSASFVVADISHYGRNVTSMDPPSLPMQAGETLYYDPGAFDNGLGFYTGTGLEWPDPDSTYGFACYFVLHDWGLVDQRAIGIIDYFQTINAPQYDYRLYIWEGQPGVLLPKSEGPHLYQNMNVTMPSPSVWDYHDVSGQYIPLPDTFWVGVCYNHFPPAESDWFLAFYSAITDPHMYLNDMDDGNTGWVPASTWGYNYPYGLRVVVEDATGVNERHVLIPEINSLNVATISKGRINVEFTLLNPAQVNLTLYDAMGRKCRQLISENVTAGKHNRSFDLDLATGAYFIHLKTDTGTHMSGKFLLFR
ncbi:T9SS type A sorting domain-containing protein, partial [candidate division WOR-3 bacterium]|nr:T9SS type A sorting domain-containing protein [candidate division WOR-3 bacterium]